MTPLPGGLPPGSSMRRPPAAAVAAPLLATAATVAATAAVTAGTVLAGRRLAGGFAAAEPGLVWLTLGGGLILLAIADAGGINAGQWARSIAARVGMVLGVAAVTLPLRADDWVSILALATAAAVCALPPRGLQRKASARPRRSESRSDSPVAPAPPKPSVPAAPSASLPPEASAAPGSLTVALAPPPDVASPPGRLQQRLERYESAEGADCVAGHVRLSIPAGSRTTHAHIGFCPAFAATPTVEVSTEYDGVEAVVTAAEVLPWGVRIECRLSEPAEEPLEIPVDLFAKSPR